jgi:general secretion pathway protein F
MPAFQYTALDHLGKTVRGTAEAESERHARRVVRDLGFIPVDVRPSRHTHPKQSRLPAWTRGLPRERLALFTQTLATLLQAGLPIDDALSAIINQSENEKMRAILVDVRAKLVEGHSFESALNNFPHAFDDVYRATVGAGEQTRHLPLVLQRLGEHVQRHAEVRSRIRMALVYPLVLITVSVLVVTGLLVYVVPEVVSVFAREAGELPLATTILIAVSGFVRAYFFHLLLALIAALWLMRRALRVPEIRRRAHAFALRLPGVSGFIEISDYARYSQTLGVLLGNGVEMLDALKIASKSAANLIIREELSEAIERVREGESLSAALAKCKTAPRLVNHLAASGETSGELPRMLEAAAASLERDVNARLTVIMHLLEPVLILVMGGLVLFIVLAILLPIFDMNTLF